MEGKFIPKIEQLVEENKGLIEQVRTMKRREEEGENKIRELVAELERLKRRVGEL